MKRIIVAILLALTAYTAQGYATTTALSSSSQDEYPFTPNLCCLMSLDKKVASEQIANALLSGALTSEEAVILLKKVITHAREEELKIQAQRNAPAQEAPEDSK